MHSRTYIAIAELLLSNGDRHTENIYVAIDEGGEKGANTGGKKIPVLNTRLNLIDNIDGAFTCLSTSFLPRTTLLHRNLVGYFKILSYKARPLNPEN